MRLTYRIAAVLCLVTAMGSAPAAAQSRGLELGADVGLGFSFGGGSTFFDIGAPTSLRVGFPIGRNLGFEPRLGFTLVSGEGETFTTLNMTPALLYALRDRSQGLYLAALPSAYLSSGFGETESQLGLGVGVGVRMPRGDRFGLRLEGQFSHFFDSDAFGGYNELRALLGVSFTTR